MDIALLSQKVMFQNTVIIADAIGNRTNAWEDYYECHATISGEGGTEVEIAGVVVENADLAVTVRWCGKAAAVTTTGYRILIGGEPYNILAIDHLSYKKKALKFKCRRVRR